MYIYYCTAKPKYKLYSCLLARIWDEKYYVKQVRIFFFSKMWQVSGTWEGNKKKLKSCSRITYEEIHFAEYLHYNLHNFLAFPFLTMSRNVNINITLKLHFLCGYGISSVALREAQRLRVSESSMMKRVVMYRRENVTKSMQRLGFT